MSENISLPYSMVALNEQLKRCWSVANSNSASVYEIEITLNALDSISQAIKSDLTECGKIQRDGRQNLAAVSALGEKANHFHIAQDVNRGRAHIQSKMNSAEMYASKLHEFEGEIVQIYQRLRAMLTGSLDEENADKVKVSSLFNKPFPAFVEEDELDYSYTPQNVHGKSLGRSDGTGSGNFPNNQQAYQASQAPQKATTVKVAEGSQAFSQGVSGAQNNSAASRLGENGSKFTYTVSPGTLSADSPSNSTAVKNGKKGSVYFQTKQSTLPRFQSNKAVASGNIRENAELFHAPDSQFDFSRPRDIRTNSQAEAFSKNLAMEILSASNKTAEGYSKYNRFIDDVGNHNIKRPDDFDGDLLHSIIARVDGYDGKPTVVPDIEFDRLAEGKMVLYRGLSTSVVDPIVTAGDMALSFIKGNLFQGVGYHGTGTYSTPDLDYSKSYSEGEDDGIYGATLKFLLSEDARVISLNDAYVKREELLESIDTSDEVGKLTALLISDVGRCAEILGYDAIALGGAENNYLVLNRSMLCVSERYCKQQDAGQ